MITLIILTAAAGGYLIYQYVTGATDAEERN